MAGSARHSGRRDCCSRLAHECSPLPHPRAADPEAVANWRTKKRSAPDKRSRRCRSRRRRNERRGCASRRRSRQKGNMPQPRLRHARVSSRRSTRPGKRALPNRRGHSARKTRSRKLQKRPERNGTAKESLKQALAEERNQAKAEENSKQRLEGGFQAFQRGRDREASAASGRAGRHRGPERRKAATRTEETLKRQLQKAQLQLARGERELQFLQSELQTARLAKESGGAQGPGCREAAGRG